MVTMTQIEEAVIARFKAKGLTGKMAIQAGSNGIRVPVSYYVSINAGDAEKAGNTSFKLSMSVVVDLVFKNLSTEEAKRKGIAPMIDSVFAILTLHDLGLSIKPLIPKGFKNITSDDDYQNGEIIYRVTFSTWMDLVAVDDEVTTGLLKVAMDYLLQPGNTNKGSDIVPLQGA